MKFTEAERLANVLSSLKGYNGKFGHFIERNLKRIIPVLRAAYESRINRTEEETKFLEARNAIGSRMQNVVETEEERAFDDGKKPFFAILQNKETTPDARTAAQADLDAYCAKKKNKAIADGLEAKYVALQEEYKKVSEDGAELLVAINAKLKAISECDVDINFYKLDPVLIPDNFPQDTSKEIDVLIQD